MTEIIIEAGSVFGRGTYLVVTAGLEDGANLRRRESAILGQYNRQRTCGDGSGRRCAIEIADIVGSCTRGDVATGSGDIGGGHQYTWSHDGLLGTEVTAPPGFPVAGGWTLSFIARATGSHCDRLAVRRGERDSCIFVSAGKYQHTTQPAPTRVERVLECVLLGSAGCPPAPGVGEDIAAIVRCPGECIDDPGVLGPVVTKAESHGLNLGTPCNPGDADGVVSDTCSKTRTGSSMSIRGGAVSRHTRRTELIGGIVAGDDMRCQILVEDIHTFIDDGNPDTE